MNAFSLHFENELCKFFFKKKNTIKVYLVESLNISADDALGNRFQVPMS